MCRHGSNDYMLQVTIEQIQAVLEVGSLNNQHKAVNTCNNYCLKGYMS